jgi:starvation-inducible DNA-binding protein
VGTTKARTRRAASPSGLALYANNGIPAALTVLLANFFALYVKTKNFHWHVSGPHFPDYHLLLDEQATQVFNTTDVIAERARKIGGTTIRSIGHIERIKGLPDNDSDFVTAQDMLSELLNDNKHLAAEMRALHNRCEKHHDVATASFLEVWIDEAERRSWFLYEATRRDR